MTTFTLQDLNIPTTADQAVEQVTKEKWMEYGMNNPLSASVTNEETLINIGKALANHEIAHQQAQQNLLNAVPPQPTPIGTPVPNIEGIINTICTQLQLLTTVITAQGNSQNTTPPEGNQSLQECVSLTLQQAEWFKDLIRHELIGAGIEDLAREAVESVVENEVESYFDHRFDVTDHFDFNDAVENAVDDRLDDIVRDRVTDSLEEVVAEKLSEASVSISF